MKKVITFLNYYFINLVRSKEKQIPIGFVFLGRPGVWFFNHFPFDLVVYLLIAFFLQLFCFGLGTELLEESNYNIDPIFLPISGFISVLLVFDYIMSEKTFFNRCKYLDLVFVNKLDKLKYKIANELLGGKLISLILFLLLTIYYFKLSNTFQAYLFLISVYLLYNSFYLLFVDFYLKNKNLAVVLFFLLQIGVIFYANVGTNNDIFGALLKIEVVFNNLLHNFIYVFVLFSILVFSFQFVINYKKLSL
jgi:hypothetical protein